MEVAGNLKELQVIKASLMGFKSSAYGFDLSPDTDKGFGMARSRDFGIFEVGKHGIEFGAHKEIHALL